MTDQPDQLAQLANVVPHEQPVRYVQVAGYPDVYSVHRSTDPAALMHRGNSGDWYVMYGWAPGVERFVAEWQCSATLPGRLTDDQAAQACVELADAHALGVPGWAELLGRLHGVGEPVLSIGRLHTPNTDYGDGRYALCKGCCADPGSYRDPASEVAWLACPTVRILAGSVGVTLPDAPQ